jgi:hypothetical protein
MQARSISALLCLFGLLLASGCDDAGSPLAIDATGELAVQAFLDRNGSGEREGGVDVPAAGLRISLLRTSGDTVKTVVTDAEGVALFSSLDLGSYRLGVSPGVLGDSLRLIWPDTTRVSVAISQPSIVVLPVGYPLVAASELASVAAGRMVTTTGTALHDANVFGDRVLHVADSTGVSRIVLTAGATVTAGDSVRITGRTGTSSGLPAILDATAFSLGTGQTPTARPIETAVAASADGGALDGALVRIADARVLSVTNLAGGDSRVRVTDGSGPVDVFIHRTANIASEDPLVAGVLLDVTGILVPRESVPGEWMLKPRRTLDLDVRIPRVTTTEAREMTAGSLVQIHGIALNGIATFGDNSVHLVDPSGALRALNVSTSFQFAGDSIRAVGILAIREGQMTLTQTTVTVLGKSTVPEPVLLATSVAATANDGDRDAALVQVRDAEIEFLSAPFGSDVTLRVNDGTGALIVILDRDTGIGTGGLAVGDKADFTGVLVPTASGSWQLKPRSPADVKKQ